MYACQQPQGPRANPTVIMWGTGSGRTTTSSSLFVVYLLDFPWAAWTYAFCGCRPCSFSRIPGPQVFSDKSVFPASLSAAPACCVWLSWPHVSVAQVFHLPFCNCRYFLCISVSLLCPRVGGAFLVVRFPSGRHTGRLLARCVRWTLSATGTHIFQILYFRSKTIGTIASDGCVGILSVLQACALVADKY